MHDEDLSIYPEHIVKVAKCGEVVSQLASGKTINEALGISSRQVIEILKGLPESSSYCSILAVSTLYRAIADYLLKI